MCFNDMTRFWQIAKRPFYYVVLRAIKSSTTLLYILSLMTETGFVYFRQLTVSESGWVIPFWLFTSGLDGFDFFNPSFFLCSLNFSAIFANPSLITCFFFFSIFGLASPPRTTHSGISSTWLYLTFTSSFQIFNRECFKQNGNEKVEDHEIGDKCDQKEKNDTSLGICQKHTVP